MQSATVIKYPVAGHLPFPGPDPRDDAVGGPLRGLGLCRECSRVRDVEPRLGGHERVGSADRGSGDAAGPMQRGRSSLVILLDRGALGVLCGEAGAGGVDGLAAPLSQGEGDRHGRVQRRGPTQPTLPPPRGGTAPTESGSAGCTKTSNAESVGTMVCASCRSESGSPTPVLPASEHLDSPSDHVRRARL